MRRKERKFLLLIAILFFVFLFNVLARSEEKREPVTDPIVLSNVISWLITDLDEAPVNKTIHRKRKPMAKEYIAAGERFGVPPLVLIVRTYFESHFRKDIFELRVQGTRNELGIMQVTEYGRLWCIEHFNECVDLSTTEKQINCGACWFAEGKRMCKHDLEKSFIAYAVGKCKTNSERTKWKIRNALRLLLRLRELIDNERI